MDKCPFTGTPCPHIKCIHVTEVANFQATAVKNMCIACGLDYIAKQGGPQFDSTSGQIFKIIDSVIKDLDIKEAQIVIQPIKGCPQCGHTLENIVLTGKIGCGHCYEHYKKELLPLIEKCQFSATQHKGKIPKKHNPNLLTLEANLKDAISKEDYEKAASLRDEIKKLQQ